MQVVLLRVAIDSGCGGIQGPLFRDGTFEYVPIPWGDSLASPTYGEQLGRHGRPLVDYFPSSRQDEMARATIHDDPEFETFTYGDPTRPKAVLRRLQPGDMLVFYGGLEGWDFLCPPALYLLGYFEVVAAGIATGWTAAERQRLFGRNFHVRHRSVYREQADRLVLIKGGLGSRLLRKAVCISIMSQDRGGHPLKILSPDMRKVFGDFGGRLAIQRSTPRWVVPEYVEEAARFVRSCE